MNPIFNNISQSTLANVEDQLVNNENAHDGELWDLMIDELGLSADQADLALTLRPLYRCHVFLSGQGPLYQSNFVSFDPHQRKLIATEPLSFDQVLSVYRILLLGRPGQRLKLGTHWAAGLNSEGHLYCTSLDPYGQHTTFEVFDFDRGAFVDGHWQCETIEQTRSAIDTPVFIR